MFHHASADDVFVSAVGLAVEQFVAGGLGSQRQRCQGIHNKIYPQHLDGCQHLLLQKTCPDHSQNYSHYVHCQLELDEFTDRVVDVAAPKHCFHDGIEIVIQQDDCCCFSGDLSSCYSHGEANISLFKCRSIVGSITSHSHNLSSLLESSYQGIFVFRSRSG